MCSRFWYLLPQRQKYVQCLNDSKEQKKCRPILSPWHWNPIRFTEGGLRTSTPLLEYHELDKDQAEAPFFPLSTRTRRMTTPHWYLKWHKEETGQRALWTLQQLQLQPPLPPPPFPCPCLPSGYQEKPLWPLFSASGVSDPLFCPALPNVGSNSPSTSNSPVGSTSHCTQPECLQQRCSCAAFSLE